MDEFHFDSCAAYLRKKIATARRGNAFFLCMYCVHGGASKG